MQEREYWRGTEISSLLPNEIFVFGSNPGGYHGLGAAKAALNFGAVMKKGRGLYGQTYALVTKNLLPNFKEYSTGIVYTKKGDRSVTKEQIIENIKDLYATARQSPHLKFLISYRYTLDKYGNPKASLNGYFPDEMIEMFTALKVPDNIIFHDSYKSRIQPLLAQQNAQQKVNEESTTLQVPDEFKESRLQEARAQRGLPPYTREELDKLLPKKAENVSVETPSAQATQSTVRRFSSKGAGTVSTQPLQAPVVVAPKEVNYNVNLPASEPVKKGGSFKPTIGFGTRPSEEETKADMILNDEFSNLSFDDVWENESAEAVTPTPPPAPVTASSSSVTKKGGSFKPSFRLGSRPPEDAPADAEEIADVVTTPEPVASVVTTPEPVAVTNEVEFNDFEFSGWGETIVENTNNSPEVVAPVEAKEILPKEEQPVTKSHGFKPSFKLGSRPSYEPAITETSSPEPQNELSNEDSVYVDHQDLAESADFDRVFLGAGNQTQIENDDVLNSKDLIPTDFFNNVVDKDVAFFVVEDNELKPLVEDKRVVENLNGSTISEAKKRLDEERMRKAEEILNKYSAPQKEKVARVEVNNKPVQAEVKDEVVSDRPKFRLGSKVLVNPDEVVSDKAVKAPKTPKVPKTPKAPPKTKEKKVVAEEKPQSVIPKTITVETVNNEASFEAANVVPTSVETVVAENPTSSVKEKLEDSNPVNEISDFGKMAGFDDFNNISFDDVQDVAPAPIVQDVVVAPVVQDSVVTEQVNESNKSFSRVVSAEVYDPFGDAHEYPEFLPFQNNVLSEVDMVERTPVVRGADITEKEKVSFVESGDVSVDVRTPSLPVEDKPLLDELIDGEPIIVQKPEPVVEKITVGVSRARFVRVKDMTPEQLNDFNVSGEPKVVATNVESVVEPEVKQNIVPEKEAKSDVQVSTPVQQVNNSIVDGLPNADEYTMFFLVNSPFSNFHPAKFYYDGLTFSSNEQFMMFAKANLFNDQASMDKIIAINNTPIVKDFLDGKYSSDDIVKNKDLRDKWSDVQKNIKSIGRGVTGYVDAVWNKEREFWVQEGASQKFIQNEDLKQNLLATNGTKMVEASPYDKIWGIGLDKATALKTPVSKWPGENRLGKVLDSVRDGINNNLIVKHEMPVVQNLPSKDDYIVFESVKSPLNNLFPAKFFYEGLTFSSNEQFMMLGKAQVFSDYDTFDKIMAVNELPLVKSFLSGEVSDKDIVSNPGLLNEWTSIQKDLIALGRGIKNYDDNVWVAERENWVKDGLDQKFAQNNHLAKWLVSTGDKKFVKLGTENVWGLAISSNDFFNTPVDSWTGTNLLGKLLEETRKDVRDNKIVIYKDPIVNNEVTSEVKGVTSTALNGEKTGDSLEDKSSKSPNPPKEKAKEESKSTLYDTTEYHFFYSLYAPFSNFHPAKFKFKGLEFSSSEQFYMYSKAKFFKNDDLANKIMQINEVPLVKQFLNGEVSSHRILRYHSQEWFDLTLEIKKIGRSFPNDNPEWNTRKENVMGVALREKFGQNDDLKQILLKTENKIIVEASPKDKFWGAGLSKDDIVNVTPDKWPGENVLGQWLGHLREKFSLEIQEGLEPEEKTKTKGRHP